MPVKQAEMSKFNSYERLIWFLLLDRSCLSVCISPWWFYANGPCPTGLGVSYLPEAGSSCETFQTGFCRGVVQHSEETNMMCWSICVESEDAGLESVESFWIRP